MAQPPYGITYFDGRPTCCCSDGRLVVDLLSNIPGAGAAAASAVEVERRRLPQGSQHGHRRRHRPRLRLPRVHRHRLPLLEQRRHEPPAPVVPSAAALHLRTAPQGCRAYLAKSLFLFGSLGGNDYNAMVLFGFTVDEAKKYTPKIVDNIVSGVEWTSSSRDSCSSGASRSDLTVLQSSNAADYDEYGCLKPFNELAIHHNSLLQSRLAGVQARHRSSSSRSPAVRIMYADYYTNVARMMKNPASSGLRSGIRACCGAAAAASTTGSSTRCAA